jgi:hypothetical protein
METGASMHRKNCSAKNPELGNSVFNAEPRLCLLLLAFQDRFHRSRIHDPEILVAIVEDGICPPYALVFELTQTCGEGLKFPFRVQIFEPLSRRNVPLIPVFPILPVKAQINLGAGCCDK